jgi:hypothetical protein
LKACAASIAHFTRFTWQESGYSDEDDACAILTTYCFKKLAILSLREVAVLLRNRVNQIGIGNKEIRKNNKQYNMRATVLERLISQDLNMLACTRSCVIKAFSAISIFNN